MPPILFNARFGPEIMDEIRIKTRWIALGIVTLIALYLCWLMLRPLVEVLEWAVVLVILFYSVHKRIAARIGRDSLSALIRFRKMLLEL